MKNCRGDKVSGASNAALELHEQALAELQCYAGDPMATSDAAVAAAPDFVMAHVLKAYLLLAGTEAAGLPGARDALMNAANAAHNERESRHVAAADALARGEYDLAAERFEDILIDYPRDVLALQIAHVFDFFRGDARALRDRVARVLALYDGPIRQGRSKVVLDMIDAAALLWRLHLRGHDVGGRWGEIADAWAPLAGDGFYAFNDVHAMMAFVGAERWQTADAVLAAATNALDRAGSNTAMTRVVGLPVCHALYAFGRGDYAATVDLLRPVRNIAARFGGSHAQRDLLDLTLIEAARRDGQNSLVRALAHERLALKPQSPLNISYLREARRSISRAMPLNAA